MRSVVLFAVLCMTAATAHAGVLCARARSDGTPSGEIHIRESCGPKEVRLAPEMVGFCCGGASTTTSTTTTPVTTSCPPVTATTLGIPDCGSSSVCFGLCSNARGCVGDGAGGCGCTGPELPCGPTSFNGACGGTCDQGLTCRLVSPIGPDGCPRSPVCACAP